MTTLARQAAERELGQLLTTVFAHEVRAVLGPNPTEEVIAERCARRAAIIIGPHVAAVLASHNRVDEFEIGDSEPGAPPIDGFEVELIGGPHAGRRITTTCSTIEVADEFGTGPYVVDDEERRSATWRGYSYRFGFLGRIPVGANLSFGRLSTVNRARSAEWHGDTEAWIGSDWSSAAAGEMGEACNIVKKLRRHDTGVSGSQDPAPEVLRSKLADEIADTILYLDLLAEHYGIDTGTAVVEKFDRVSVREGFEHRLGADR